MHSCAIAIYLYLKGFLITFPSASGMEVATLMAAGTTDMMGEIVLDGQEGFFKNSASYLLSHASWRVFSEN